MPRRATTHWSGSRRRLPRLGAAVVVVALLGLAVACVVVNPFAAAPVGVGPVATGADGQDLGRGSAANLGSGAAQTLSAGATATALASFKTVRKWQTDVPGIIDDPVLASRLDQALAGVDGHVGVAVKDLGSGRGAVVDGNLELQSASLYKLPVLYTVFDLGLNLSEPLTITQEALSYDSGTMELGPGETLTVAEALERMVTLSDNTSAILLGSRVGAGNVTASIAALGMDTTHYSVERMTTSALDMLRFLELLARGQAVSPAASADMVHLLLRQRVNDRLPRLVPDDVQVAHKTGNLPGVVNDVGILYGPSSTIAVAALVSDTTDETAAATAIAQVGLAANSYFEQQPPVSDRPLIPPAPSRPVPPVWREPHPPPPTPEPVILRAPTTRVVQPAVPATVVALPPTALPTVTSAPTVAAAISTLTPGVNLSPREPAMKPTAPPPAPAATRAAPAAPTPTPVPPPAIPTATTAPPPPTSAPVVPTRAPVRATLPPTATPPNRH